jgi:formylglycine-generating enzyme required for sulfatase activity
MTGNVWEWCQDYFDETYYEQKAGRDPQGPLAGNDRVIRGGSSSGTARIYRSAYREGMVPGFRSAGFGFRICFTVE